MERNTIIIGAVLLIAGLGIGYALPRTSPTSTSMHMMPNGASMSQNIDQHFIVQMIPHHEGAIDMARVALEKAARPEVLSLANGIIAAQEKEITDMRDWYQSWFGSMPPAGGMGMMHMGGMSGDRAVLERTSTSDFDREFVEQMIPHHEMAIMMAQMLQAATDRPEMKELAENIITSQSREIQMMRSWLTTWTS